MSSKQLKITLPAKLIELLRFRADAFGLTMASYVKNLIVQDAKEITEIGILNDENIEKSYQDAIKNKDERISFKSVKELDEYFKNL